MTVERHSTCCGETSNARREAELPVWDNFRGATMKIKGSLLMSVPIISGLAGSRDLYIRVAADPIFGIPDPDLPIHYTTFMGLRRRLRVVY